MANGFGWQDTSDAVDVALVGAAAMYVAAGAALKGRLKSAGGAFDRQFPAGSVETAEHIAWRAAFGAALTELDALAAAIDGEPATTIDPADPGAVTIKIRSRASTASKRVHPLAHVVADAAKFKLPIEPQKFGPLAAKLPASTTYADLEKNLRAVIAEADAFIAFLA